MRKIKLTKADQVERQAAQHREVAAAHGGFCDTDHGAEGLWPVFGDGL